MNTKGNKLMKKLGWKKIVVVSLFFSVSIQASIGSDTAFTRFNTQQTLVNGASVLGGAALDGGFILANALVTATWSSFIPVSGIIDINNGTLVLDLDLITQNGTTPTTINFGSGVGSINGQGHALELAENITVTGSGAALTDLAIRCQGDTFFSDMNIGFFGNCVIDGKENTIFIAASNLIAEVNSQLTIKNATVVLGEGGNIGCVDNNGEILFENVILVLQQDLTFNFGSFTVQDKLKIVGPGRTVNYTSSVPLTINSISTLIFDEGLTFFYESGNASPQSQFVFIDSTSLLIMRGSTLQAFAAGLQLLAGTIQIERQSTFNALGTTVTTGIILGDGTNVGNNITLQITPAAQLILQGSVVNNSAS